MQQKSRTECTIPEMLYRILYENNPHGYGIKGSFNQNGHLLPTNGLYPSIVPLVHPEEWEIIARWLCRPNNEYHGAFTLLKILTKGLKNISCKSSFILKNGEFFATVNIRDIIMAEDYEWEKMNEHPNIPPEILHFYRHELRYSTGYKPKLIASYKPNPIISTKVSQ